jgi:anaerobic ribonucleoside-triphosphate reductase activating protein
VAIIKTQGITWGTEVNGPGRRNMVHVQGCTIQCPGCFNPHTWDHAAYSEAWSHDRLADLLLRDRPGGVTISGGEPMEQAEAVQELLRCLRERNPTLSTLMYTGFTRARLERSDQWALMRPHLDVVVAGPYRRDLHVKGGGLVSSSNQELMLMGRHTAAELVPAHQVEVLVEPDGTIILTGFPSQQLIRKMEAL